MITNIKSIRGRIGISGYSGIGRSGYSGYSGLSPLIGMGEISFTETTLETIVDDFTELKQALIDNGVLAGPIELPGGCTGQMIL